MKEMRSYTPSDGCVKKREDDDNPLDLGIITPIFGQPMHLMHTI